MLLHPGYAEVSDVGANAFFPVKLRLGPALTLFTRRFEAHQSLGVRPSNRHDSHITSCCAPRMYVATLGDGRIGVQRGPELDDGSRLVIKYRGDTA
jgi:hypothetical protein